MKNPTIGIKIADGSYFPIMEEGSLKRKRLVLTTVNDNQENVQIDLYKGDGEELLDAVYVGSLLIENITQGPKESSEIELKLGFAQDGTLNAEAGDPGSGQYESMSISMETLGESSVYDTPDFSLDNEMEDLQIDDLSDEDPDINLDIEELSLDDDIEDLQLDDLVDEDQDINLDIEELSLDDDMEDFQLDAPGDEDQDINLDIEELSLDDDMEDFQLDDPGDEDPDINLDIEELSLDDDMEDLQLDDLVDEDQDINLDIEELSLDDDMEDLQLDDPGDEDLEIDMVGEELSLDDDDLSFDDSLEEELPVPELAEGDIDELTLDDEVFDFDDLEEEDSLEVEDFDMEVDDEELFDESSMDITEDGFEETSDSDLEEEDDYTPGILSESETVHKKEKEGGNPLLIALLVIIAIATIAGISYLLFRSLQGEDSPNLEAKAGTEETVSEAESEAPEPIAEDTEESTNGEQPKDETTAVPELAVQESTKILDSTGVWYKIRWGDTLRGISYSFYDSPRDYNDIVKENKIKNPDIIFAETEIFIPSR